jgi:amidohydrolase
MTTTSWHDMIDEAAEEEMISWRRHLHAHPELSFQEHETTAFIAERLAEWDIAAERPCETGVVARLRGGAPGPTIALRADIDALPIEEENAFGFASTAKGVMHACGHDGHTALVLGVARAMSRLQGGFAGEIRLLFQPAEEVIPGGASALIDAGALRGVDRVVGLHLWSAFETGLVSVRPGAIMASTDEFRLAVRGPGGHGAFPHQTPDSLVAAAAIVGELQTIVSRRIDPLAPAVVTVGTFHGGTAFNIIPSEVRLSGTVRALDEGVRERIQAELGRTVEHVALAHDVAAELAYTRGNPTVVNDAGTTDVLRDAATAVAGADRVIEAEPAMGGDDFGFYSQTIPSSYVWVGARNPEVGAEFPHHHPRFTVDEASLGIGARVMLAALQRLATASA